MATSFALMAISRPRGVFSIDERGGGRNKSLLEFPGCAGILLDDVRLCVAESGDADISVAPAARDPTTARFSWRPAAFGCMIAAADCS